MVGFERGIEGIRGARDRRFAGKEFQIVAVAKENEMSTKL